MSVKRVLGLTLLLLAGMALGAGVPRLSAMSYNIRYDDPEDPYLWGDRQEEIVELIEEMQPDLLGVQEALKHQVEDLAAGLTGYTHVGVGRGAEVSNGAQPQYQPDAGEFNAIFYRTDKLQLLESDTFWLSNTPNIAGSTLAGASLPRIVTWARFKVRESGKVFVGLNTHFPYESGSDGEAARAFSAGLILNRLPQLAQGKPVLLMGDLNMAPDSGDDLEQTYLPLTSVFADSLYAEALKLGPEYTFTGFEITDDGERLDYILVSRNPKITLLLHEVIDEDNGTYFLSDHLPVYVVFTLP